MQRCLQRCGYPSWWFAGETCNTDRISGKLQSYPFAGVRLTPGNLPTTSFHKPQSWMPQACVTRFPDVRRLKTVAISHLGYAVT